ncbi:hypothetical protein J6590_052334 [Homalodisca vitripennis]|nr:hypothetical protein J6590_052334 [Homalodisca vitripennis]
MRDSMDCEMVTSGVPGVSERKRRRASDLNINLRPSTPRSRAIVIIRSACRAAVCCRLLPLLSAAAHC